jgi:hypothetical protein
MQEKSYAQYQLLPSFQEQFQTVALISGTVSTAVEHGGEELQQ